MWRNKVSAHLINIASSIGQKPRCGHARRMLPAEVNRARSLLAFEELRGLNRAKRRPLDYRSRHGRNSRKT